jgi:choline dehydrogenase
VGGSSSVNGGGVFRPTREDFDEWVALGLDLWSWKDMLRCLVRLEDDQDFDDPFHGKGGPIPVVRWKDEEFRPVSRAFLAAALEHFPYCLDQNAPDATGVAPLPMNRRGRLRVSTAVGYLGPAMDRRNLQILADCEARRVIFDQHRRAVGVEVVRGGRREVLSGGQIILCAGAIMSPVLLMWSGIGPATELQRFGIDCLVDLPGVGANLMDHPSVPVAMVPLDGLVDPDNDPTGQVNTAYTSPEGRERNDMQLIFVCCLDTAGYLDVDFGSRVITAAYSAIQRPRSRGWVRLSSPDPTAPPNINLNLLDDPEDIRRLRDGVRLAWTVASHPSVQECTKSVIGLTPDVVEDDAQLDAYARGCVATYLHASGTCKMGIESDAMAVLDQHCRVRGVEGLRVVDASIMPNIVRVNTNFSCIAFGERMAEIIAAE